MDFLGRIIELFHASMNTPELYKWFHILFLIITAVVTTLICYIFRDCSQKKFNKIVLSIWIIMIILEIYKQVAFSFSYVDGKVYFDYNWNFFPFQLCSTPFYVFPLICFMKEGKTRDTLISYAMTFSLFGGIAVMLYPGDVFYTWIGINIQTMIHHGSQVAIGIFCVVHNRMKLNIKYWAKGIILFVIFVTIAFLLNVVVGSILQNDGIGEVFNMFYIGPYYPCTLPLLSVIYPNIPYVLFLILYVLGFILISFIIFIIEYKIYKLVLKKNEKLKEI